MIEKSSDLARTPKSVSVLEEFSNLSSSSLVPATSEKNDITEAKKQSMEWHQISDEAVIKFRNKDSNIKQITSYVSTLCKIPEFPDLGIIRSMEEKIGNLISEIYIERSRASFAYGKLETQRIARLGTHIDAKDRRSMSAIEARLSAHDVKYKTIIALTTDCKATLDFWHDMYNICLRTTDRLKQISMALMAEMKLEPSEMGGRGDKVRGRGY